MINNRGINQDNRVFFNFLQDDILCQGLMQRNKLSIHIETGNIYYDNIDTGESIYSFFVAQQHDTKRLMPKEFRFFDNYEDYVKNDLTQIESESDDPLDMLTHKNTKFLFYQFNQYLAQIEQPLKFIKHTLIADNNYAVTVIQEKNGSILLNVCWRIPSNNKRWENIFSRQYTSRKCYSKRLIKNITICKNVYKNLYGTVADRSHQALNYIDREQLKKK